MPTSFQSCPKEKFWHWKDSKCLSSCTQTETCFPEQQNYSAVHSECQNTINKSKLTLGPPELANAYTTFNVIPSNIGSDISVWTAAKAHKRCQVSSPIILGLNLLEWWQCCLVHVAASLWSANSHIISFFIRTFCENCTCINKQQ